MSCSTASSGSARSTALLLAASLLLAACPWRDARPAPAPTQAVLFFSADVKGYLGPCGCSENMRGGVARAAAEIAKARATGAPVFLVDTGDGLFSAASIPEPAVGQQERKARAMADAMKAMGLSVRAPGPFDDARGPAFRESLQLPEVTRGGTAWLDAKGHRLAVVSAGDVARASALGAVARSQGAAFVVALVPQAFDVALRGAVDASGVDLVVTQPKDELAAEVNRAAGGAVKVAQLQDKGRSLLRVDLSLRDGGRLEWLKGTGERDRELSTLDERIELMRAQVNEPGLNDQLKALKQAKLADLVSRREELANTPLPAPEDRNAATFRFVPLEFSLPQDPTVAAIEAGYDRDVGLLNLAWAKEHGKPCDPPDLDRAGFVGSAACIGCHPDAARVWKTTKHTQAYESLVHKGKQYHLDCVPCHLTGWQQPGGVCRIDDVDERTEVGCESCHGPGWRHTQMPVKQHIHRGREAATCTGCHDRENSPHFEFETYLKRIVGPGHGLPRDAGAGP